LNAIYHLLCGLISVITAVSAFSITGYNLGKDESWWNCPQSQQQNCMSDISTQWVWEGNQQQCLLPEVVIYGV